MPLISVIVTCYNIEEYLEQCLESVVNQTLQDMEIIVVDDGSSDSTADTARSRPAVNGIHTRRCVQSVVARTVTQRPVAVDQCRPTRSTTSPTACAPDS